MTIYAVIKTGGKQYKVAPGDVVRVEKLAVATGAMVEIREVYLVANAQGITTGNPIISNARVVAEVVGEGRDKKILVFKKRRRKGYQKTIGHRQYFTTLRINEIALGPDVHKAQATTPRAAARPGIETELAEAVSATSAPSGASTAKTVSDRKTPAPIGTPPSKPKSPARSDRNAAVTPVPVDPNPIAETATTPTDLPAETLKPDTIAPESIDPGVRPDNAPAHIPIDAVKTEIPAPAVSGARDTRTVDTPIPARSLEPAEEQEIRNSDIPAIRSSDKSESRSDSNLRYWVLAALVIVLLSGIGMIFFGDLGRRMPEDAVPDAVEPQENRVEPEPSKTKRAAPDLKIKKPVAGTAPSAPVQPPD